MPVIKNFKVIHEYVENLENKSNYTVQVKKNTKI